MDIVEKLRNNSGSHISGTYDVDAADLIDNLRSTIREFGTVVIEYLAAYDAALDPKAVGSTCRLIRAESNLRYIVGAGDTVTKP
jgi:hypothetical protein